MDLWLRFAARSFRGYARPNNEDAIYAGPRLLALADGMGGHAAGEVAAALAIAAMAPLNSLDDAADPIEELRAATARANAAIGQHVEVHPDLAGMGTTLTALLFAGGRVHVGHVGDSRAYLLRDGALKRITKDETFVQTLVDRGDLTDEEARVHPRRNVVLRAVTGQPDLEPALITLEAKPGDRYLICSDGLSDEVPDETIRESLQIEDPQKSLERLVWLALHEGGRDNISCIVADVSDIDLGYDIAIAAGAAGHEGALITDTA